MDIFILAVVILAVLFSFFLLYMSYKSWKVLHIISAFMVFAAAIVFMIYAAMSLKTRTAWLEVNKKLEEQLEKAQQEEVKLLHGDLTELVQTEPSIRSTRQEIFRVLLDRGRVWEHAVPAASGNSIVLTTYTPQPGEDPAAAKPNGIDVDSIVYVFREEERNVDGFPMRLPVEFLGEFQVTAATNTTATITALDPNDPDSPPTLPVDGRQINAALRSTWSLYEIMPIDNHDILESTDQDARQRELADLMPPTRLKVPPDQYASIIAEYRHDAAPAEENDPPDRIWVKVKFLKPHQIDVDAAPSAKPLETIQFDTLGRAVVNSLRQGEPTQFAVGDFALFDQETAEQLTRDGLVEKVELVYVRQLRDYATYFHEFQRRMDVLQERIDAVQADTQSLVNAKAKAEQQLAYRTDEKAKLAQDLTNFTLERDEVAKFLAQLEQQRQQTRDKLSELYRANYQLAEELARLQKEMLDKINQRSADAMAQAIP
jgi:hypothetical protein